MGIDTDFDLLVSGRPEQLAQFSADPRCIDPSADGANPEVAALFADRIRTKMFEDHRPWPSVLASDLEPSPCHRYYSWSWENLPHRPWFESLVALNPELSFGLLVYEDSMDETPGWWEFCRATDGSVAAVEHDSNAVLATYVTAQDWLRAQCRNAADHPAGTYCWQCQRFVAGRLKSYRAIAARHAQGAHALDPWGHPLSTPAHLTEIWAAELVADSRNSGIAVDEELAERATDDDAEVGSDGA